MLIVSEETVAYLNILGMKLSLILVLIGIQKGLLWQDLKDLQQLHGTSKWLTNVDEEKLFLLTLN